MHNENSRDFLHGQTILREKEPGLSCVSPANLNLLAFLSSVDFLVELLH